MVASDYVNYPTECPGCAAYVHRFLSECPACGTAHRSSLEVHRREPIALPPDAPRATEDLAPWLAANGGDPSLAAEISRDIDDEIGQGVEDGTFPLEARSELIPYFALAAVASDFDLSSVPPIVTPLILALANSADRLASRLTFRYLGGLPRYPSPMDVKLRIGFEQLTLSDTRTQQPLAVVSSTGLLSASAYLQDDPLFPASIGLLAGPLIVFPKMSTPGGALTILWSGPEGPGGFAIGNRSGWHDKGQPEYYQSLADIIGSWSDFSVRLAESSQGTAAVASQLGLPLPTPIDDETKVCPDCAETVKLAARKCRFCGYEFSA